MLQSEINRQLNRLTSRRVFFEGRYIILASGQYYPARKESISWAQVQELLDFYKTSLDQQEGIWCWNHWFSQQENRWVPPDFTASLEFTQKKLRVILKIIAKHGMIHEKILRMMLKQSDVWCLIHQCDHDMYTVGKISIWHVIIFLRKHIWKGAIDMKFSPHVGNNPSNPYIQRNQNKPVKKLKG